jgi:hypothetical protein
MDEIVRELKYQAAWPIITADSIYWIPLFQTMQAEVAASVPSKGKE